MGLFKSTIMTLLAICMFTSTFSLSVTAAQPQIIYHTQQVYLKTPGQATIVGYFENTGDQTGYIKSFQHDLIINNQDDSQLIWRGHNIHYTTNIKVAPQQKVKHVFHVKNKHIPRYTQRYHWQVKNVHFHWNTSAH